MPFIMISLMKDSFSERSTLTPRSQYNATDTELSAPVRRVIKSKQFEISARLVAYAMAVRLSITGTKRAHCRETLALGQARLGQIGATCCGAVAPGTPTAH